MIISMCVSGEGGDNYFVPKKAAKCWAWASIASVKHLPSNKTRERGADQGVS